MGLPHTVLQILGMAGNQVLEWADLDSEIKTAGVKNVSAYYHRFFPNYELTHPPYPNRTLWLLLICEELCK